MRLAEEHVEANLAATVAHTTAFVSPQARFTGSIAELLFQTIEPLLFGWLHGEWALGRRPDLQNVPIKLRHANMGLHGIVLRAGEGERIFEDKI